MVSGPVVFQTSSFRAENIFARSPWPKILYKSTSKASPKVFLIAFRSKKTWEIRRWPPKILETQDKKKSKLKKENLKMLLCKKTYEPTISKEIGRFLTMIGPRNLVLDCYEEARRPSYNKRILTKNLKVANFGFLFAHPIPVSYTHLTLPTICSV